jgi:hypothetical protein
VKGRKMNIVYIVDVKCYVILVVALHATLAFLSLVIVVKNRKEYLANLFKDLNSHVRINVATYSTV